MGTSTTGGGGASSAVEITQIVSPGILVSLSLFTAADLDENFQSFASIGVKIPTARHEDRRVELTQGYLKEESGLTWTGFYPLHAGDSIFAWIRGNVNPIFHLVDRRLTANTLIIQGVELGDILTAIKTR